MKSLNENKSLCYIYDLDGTLIDSLDLWSDLASSFLNEKGIHCSSEVDKEIEDFSLNESSQYLKESFNLQESEEIIKNDIINKLYDSYAHSVFLKPGVKAFLEKQAKKGRIQVVATATDRKLAEVVLKNNNVYQYFSLIKTETEVGEAKTSSVRIFDKILEELKINKKDVVVFEDSEKALKELHRCGYKTVGVYDRHNKVLNPFLCDYYIKEFSEI